MSKKVDLNAPQKQSNNVNKHRSQHPNTNNRTQQENPENKSKQKDKSNVNQIGTSSMHTSSVSNTVASDGTTEDLIDEKLSNVKIMLKIKIVGGALLILLPFIAILFLALSVVTLFTGEDSGSGGSLGIGGYYKSQCDEITVISVDADNGYTATGSKTYSLNDYIAGVVYAEVGGFQTNLEYLKTFAVAARSYGLSNVDESCTIEGSARRQAFRDITNNQTDKVKAIYEAVDSTDGIVLLRNDKLYVAEYDAFAVASVDESYYTLKQQNQKIPVSWVEANISEASLKYYEDHHHGRGMSQHGAYYLASEQSYTYDEILSYYYGDEITISKNSYTTNIANLSLKDTTNAQYTLNKPLDEFLSENGSSVSAYNEYIYSNVKEAGVGTRDGVLAAAISLVNYLYDNYDAKLPYYWGGNYQYFGIDSTFGSYQQSATVSRNGQYHYIKSFDCSGFVSWAIKNGGYNLERLTTVGFDQRFSSNSCLISSTDCIGEPGDLINSSNGHVELILAVDTESSTYFVAEADGQGVVITTRNFRTENGTDTKILHLKEFYENPNNIASDYPV